MGRKNKIKHKGIIIHTLLGIVFLFLGIYQNLGYFFVAIFFSGLAGYKIYNVLKG